MAAREVEMGKDDEISTSKTSKPGKLKDYLQLVKFTLSFMVVFSTVVSYLIAPETEFQLGKVLLLFVAGMLITGSSNAINQILEIETDAIMKRTASRPLPAGRMAVMEAYIFAVLAGIIGVAMMWFIFNPASAMLSLGSLLVYSYVYTPLKKVNSLAVLVGAIPGALPCLIGWVAATNEFSAGGWVLFAIQFLWQFPHFWAIAWLAHTDYTKAGFKLLPNEGGPTRVTALQTIMYSMLMVPVGLLPRYYGLSDNLSMWILLVCNLTMVYLSIMLYIRMDAGSARKVMFGSYFYLMIVLLSLYADKA